MQVDAAHSLSMLVELNLDDVIHDSLDLGYC